jgi:hypothetical protein
MLSQELNPKNQTQSQQEKTAWQKVWQKLNSPEYTKITGKKLFLYSVALNVITLLINIVFSRILDIIQSSIIDFGINQHDNLLTTTLNFIGGLSIIGMILGLLLWLGKYCNNSCYCNNFYRPKTMSILDPRNPAGPNYWNKH